MLNSEKALRWIVDVLSKNKVPFQITGGLAGKAFGNPRILNDIDIDIPEKYFRKILPDVKSFIEFGPEKYKDDDWDLMLLTLNYNGQHIDLGGSESAKAFNKSTHKWEIVPCDLTKAIKLEVMGIAVPVVCPEDYIAYKKFLNRIINGIPIDKEDAEYAKKYLEKLRKNK